VLLLKATTESLQVTNSIPALIPTLKGYTYINNDVTSTLFTISPDNTISTGDWMIMVIESYSTVTWTDPTGWTVIQAQGTIAGTLLTSIYAKNRVAGETSYTLAMPGGHANASTLTLMWGSGAAPIANWVIGTNMARGSISPATSYNNLAPGITTTTNNNLVLVISSERYTGTPENSLVSMTGATQWFFKGQPNTTEIETLGVGYILQTTAGTTSNATITYNNPQAANGMAIQIGLPPATGTLNYSVSYTDSTTSTVNLSSSEGVISTPTVTTAVPAPAASTTRLIKLISISNTDPYVSNTIVVQKNIGGKTYNIGSTITLLAGEMAQYIDKKGWKYYSATGTLKSDQTLINSSVGQLQYNNGSNILDTTANPYITTWTQQIQSGTLNWNCITMSADGTHLAGAVNSGYIWTSSNSGVTWTQQTSGLATQDWTGIASSADGSHLAAIDFGNTIYTSTNYGVTWTSQTGSGSRNWLQIASSADGTMLAAAVQNSSIYTSSNSGVTWTQQTSSPSIDWAGIASSSDGTHLVGAGTADYIYISTNSGVTWTTQTAAGSRNWDSVACSSDGTHIVAAVNPGYIWTTTNTGATWTQQTSAGSQAWESVASSADGTRLAAAVTNGYIYVSTNSGVTWTAQTSAGIQGWDNLVSSTDGMKLATAVYGGNVYTSSTVQVVNPTWSTAANNGLASTIQSNLSYSTWTEQTGSTSQTWSAMASSTDGTKLAATVNGGYIYTSTNSGVTWTQQTASTSQTWTGIASSSDGVNLAAIVSGGYVYTSTNSGVAWTQQTASTSQTWTGIASSSDGSFILAVSSGGNVYTSINSGVAWTQQTGAPSQVWSVAASSVDGNHLAIANTSNGYIYTSVNAGVTWTQQTGATSQVWSALVSSFDGSHLAAANTSNGYIYTSTNFGVTWTQTAAPSQVWSALVSSSDGTHLAAANTSNGYIYTSPDSGVTWIQTAAPSLVWSAVASSSDGTHLAAANTSNGYIYTDVISLGYNQTQAIANTTIAPELKNNLIQTFVSQTGSTSQSWNGIASSADGTKLVAIPYTGYIYTSTDSGYTWTQQTGSTSQTWTGIASSADGTKLVAVPYSGYICTSIDSGVTWVTQTGSTSQSWYGIASSSDGTHLSAIPGSGYIYTSTNSGVTWTQQTGSTSQGWYAIASSADGTKLVAVPNSGYVYTSTNSGVTWTTQTGSTSQSWNGVASSSDGTKLVAIVYGGYIYTSTNSGVTWTVQTGSTFQNWWRVASSADGTKLFAIPYGSYVYMSTNGGISWTIQTGSTAQSWFGIATSSDGSKLAIAPYGGYISTAVIPQVETNTLLLAGGNAQLALNAWNLDPSSAPIVSSTGAYGSYIATGTTASIPVPPGVVSGSLVVVFIYSKWTNSPTFPGAVTPATGFFLGGSWPYQDTVYSVYSGIAWYYKYATGVDSGTYSFVMGTDSLGAAAHYANGYAHIITGGPTSGDPFVDTILFAASSTAVTSIGISTFTPGANNSLLLAGAAWDYDGGSGGAVLGFPTGWGNIAQYDDTTNTVVFGTGYTVQSTATATGALSFTTNKSSPGNAILVTIRPSATASPYTLNANTAATYARSTANNATLSVLDTALIPMSLQSSLWQNNFMMWTPGPANVGTWVGTNGTNVNSGTGVTASTLPTTTNVYTAMRRTTIATAVTTANQSVGLRSDLMFFQGTAAGQGGFFFSCRFGFDVITAGCRAFVGFTTSTTPVTADPSTLTNIIGFGFDVADTAWSFYHNGSVGTAIKEPISGQGVLATNNTGYDAYIWCAPYSRTVYYRLDRTDTGATIANSSVSSNLPLITSLTTLMAEVMMSNGANTAVGAATLGINRLYVETIR